MYIFFNEALGGWGWMGDGGDGGGGKVRSILNSGRIKFSEIKMFHWKVELLSVWELIQWSFGVLVNPPENKTGRVEALRCPWSHSGRRRQRRRWLIQRGGAAGGGRLYNGKAAIAWALQKRVTRGNRETMWKLSDGTSLFCSERLNSHRVPMGTLRCGGMVTSGSVPLLYTITLSLLYHTTVQKYHVYRYIKPAICTFLYLYDNNRREDPLFSPCCLASGLSTSSQLHA